MTARYVRKVGDIFCITLNDGTLRYVQYVAVDRTQLESDIIAAYKKSDHTDWSDTSHLEIDFIAHVFLKVCIKYGGWMKVGHAPAPDVGDVLFCLPNILSESPSEDPWYVWVPNSTFREVESSSKILQKAAPGEVYSYISIEKRLRTGDSLNEIPGSTFGL